jgi:hypothetical protein
LYSGAQGGIFCVGPGQFRSGWHDSTCAEAVKDPPLTAT